jgi:DNA-binding CsgD family transcriptional regulator
VLIGRESECERLEELLDRARVGRSGALVIRGEAGIGKTALLDYAAETAAEGMTVVRALGVESEAELEFSALLDVCRPLLDHLPEIPEPQAAALRAALDLGPGVDVDRFAIGAATLGLLAAAAEANPLLVLVDDAQWLDPSSGDALFFATRRLQADRVLVVCAVREGEGRPLETRGIEAMTLTGLSPDEAARLLGQQAEVPPEVSERLYEATGGNPLALIELPSLLTPEQIAGVVPLADPLRAGASVERAFARRAEELPDDGRRALLVAAVSMSDAMKPLVDALGSLGVDASALEPAEDAGLVQVGGGRFEFRHPLVRSAVYHAALPSERRAAHRALAAAHVDGNDAQRAWHLAAAALGPDEQVAASLATVAERARERRAHAEAAAALEKAAWLTPDPAKRLERLARAAEDVWDGGDSHDALRLVAEAEPLGVANADRARLLELRGRIERRVGVLATACDLLLEAESLIGGTDRLEQARILSYAAPAAAGAGELPLALEIARRLRDLAPRDDSFLDAHADEMLGWVLSLSGHHEDARPYLERSVDVFLAAERTTWLALAIAGMALRFLERLAESDELALRAARMAREEGPRALLTALELLTLSDVQAGRWALAEARIDEGLELARPLAHADQRLLMLMRLATVEAARGDEDRCRVRTEEIVAGADACGFIAVRPQAQATLGLLELGLQRLDPAIDALERAAAEIERLGLHDRDTTPHPDLVEALLRSGRHEQAAEVLARYAERARRGTPLWGGALLARCQGMLAEDELEAEAHFDDALALHAQVEDRFQQARTLLVFGERLRRTGRRRDARERLHVSLKLFEQLDARPWSERARRELRASGERLRRRADLEAEQLTPQELQIALQVAEGKTNKDVGAALFLSHKTVEFHLSRIYRKLDINSRAELIRRFASEQAGAVSSAL